MTISIVPNTEFAREMKTEAIEAKIKKLRDKSTAVKNSIWSRMSESEETAQKREKEIKVLERLNEGYVNVGNTGKTFVDKDLYESHSIIGGKFGKTVLKLKNGTTIVYIDSCDNNHKKPAVITKNKDGSITVQDFNKHSSDYTGTDGDDSINFVNSSSLNIRPGDGTDRIKLEGGSLNFVLSSAGNTLVEQTIGGYHEVRALTEAKSDTRVHSKKVECNIWHTQKDKDKEE